MKSARDIITPFNTTLLFERILPYHNARRLRVCIATAGLTTGCGTILLSLVPNLGNPVPWFGATLVFLALWLDLFLLFAYRTYWRHQGLDSVSGSAGKRKADATYLAAVALASDRYDVTRSWWLSSVGQDVATRIGISNASIITYLKETGRPKTTIDEFFIPTEDTVTIVTIAISLYEADPTLASWLQSQKISRDSFVGAVTLIMRQQHTAMRAHRWWSRDNLSRQRGIGRELSFGHHDALVRFARPLTLDQVAPASLAHCAPYLSKIEDVLASGRASNVLLIGDAGSGTMDIIVALANHYATGNGLRALHHPHIYAIDMDIVFSNFGTAEQFGNALNELLYTAARAGNVILVFEHFSNLIERARNIGIDAVTIFDDYLSSSALHIIAVDTPSNWQTQLRTHAELTRFFTEITVTPVDTETTINILIDQLPQFEHKHKLTFTVDAIKAIATGAVQYITQGVMPERAITLMANIATHAERHHVTYVTTDVVERYIHSLTGAPIGPLDKTERDTLLQLEDILSTSVHGQALAVQAIARTMRRSRANIERHNRPIGSFLFLGPTGVGKTETAKTLARVFFGSVDALIRFDMSEYSQADSLGLLLGSGDTSGRFTDLFTEHPYAVVLLDEFEKAHQSIHDLFLQILDEGRITNTKGEVLQAKNCIFIATSNAGSDFITRTHGARVNAPELHNEVVQYIVQHNYFRPELVNRFDNVVIFEPLSDRARRAIARRALTDLTHRVYERGFVVTFTEDVVDLITEQAFDASMGARPVARFVQNLVEDHIATAIIAGVLEPGIPYQLARQHFTDKMITAALST